MLCLARGSCHVLCVGYSEIFLLGNPGVLSAADFPGLGQELDLLPAVIALFASGKSLLGRCQGRDVAVPPRQCLQHHRNGYLHPEWEQAEPGMSLLLLLLCRSCSPKGMECQSLLWYKLLELSLQSCIGTQGCQGLDTFTYGMS